MTEETCPNGCDLATFGTHAGPPDCDLQPADPDARLVTARVRVDGREQLAEVALPGASLPRVRADSVTLDPTRSVAVELCLFRLCEWQSVDIRASTREQRDAAYREHLRREHADELDRLAGLIP